MRERDEMQESLHALSRGLSEEGRKGRYGFFWSIVREFIVFKNR